MTMVKGIADNSSFLLANVHVHCKQTKSSLNTKVNYDTGRKKTQVWLPRERTPHTWASENSLMVNWESKIYLSSLVSLNENVTSYFKHLSSK